MKTLTFTTALMLAAISPASEQDELNIDEARVSLIHEVRVPAQEAGVLVQLHALAGSTVKKGDPLARIDQQRPALEAEVAELQRQVAGRQSEDDINLRFAQKSREVSIAELNRALQAVQTFAKSVSKTELDQQRLVVERSALAIEQADLELSVARLTSELRERESQIAKLRLNNRLVVAPLGGIVVETYPQVGEWIQTGEAILRIIRLDRLRVEAFVDGQRYDAELLGRPVVFNVALPQNERREEFGGNITFVSPELHPVTGQIRIWAEVDNPDGLLRPGMKGKLLVRPQD